MLIRCVHPEQAVPDGRSDISKLSAVSGYKQRQRWRERTHSFASSDGCWGNKRSAIYSWARDHSVPYKRMRRSWNSHAAVQVASVGNRWQSVMWLKRDRPQTMCAAVVSIGVCKRRNHSKRVHLQCVAIVHSRRYPCTCRVTQSLASECERRGATGCCNIIRG